MSSVEEKVNNLLDVLKNMDLDFNWLLAVISLSAQEMAIKWKLDMLNESYGEEDFQELSERLIKTMEKMGLETPHILLSIARSYRHIRAKIMHDPHRTRLKMDEANAIFYNTEALVRVLFAKETGRVNILKFVDSIDRNFVNQKAKEFSDLSESDKTQIFEATLNKLSLLEWRESSAYEGLFDFLKEALKAEPNAALQGELFVVLLSKSLVGGPVFGKEKLFAIIAEFTRLGSIRKLIRERGLLNSIIAEYEASNNFYAAAYNAETMLNLALELSPDHTIRVVDAALSNDQIAFSWGAKPFLNRFLSVCSDKIPAHKKGELLGVLNSQG